MRLEVLIIVVLLIIVILFMLSSRRSTSRFPMKVGCQNFVPLRTDQLAPLPVINLCSASNNLVFTANQSAYSLFGQASYCSSSDPWIYANSDGQLAKINVQTQQLVVIGNIGIVLYDIAFATNGVLYGTNPNGTQLYSLSLTTGAATLLGPLSTNLCSTSLAGGPDGFLYGIYGTSLRKANPITRVVTTVRNDVTDSIGDCVFIGSDFYWSTSSSNVIKKITGNVATGVITTIGSCSSSLYALANVGCDMWGIDGFTVFKIDKINASTSNSFTVSSFGGTYVHGGSSRTSALLSGGAYLVNVASLDASCLPVTLSFQQTTLITFSDPLFTHQIAVTAGGSFTITSGYAVTSLVNAWIVY